MSDSSVDRPVHEPSDAELITATRAGDTDAYAILYQRHANAARTLARHLARDESEAEDLVAETFVRVLALLRRGGGPQVAFRPYLHTALRRIKYDRTRVEQQQLTMGELENFDPGMPFVDPALEGLERSLVARAFLSLPERWQVVLWHTEIEGSKPADVAPLLGMSANGVAALAYRAREGLRRAYLQTHLQGAPAEPCQPVLDKLGSYVRGGLSRRDKVTVEAHLESCSDCAALHAELVDVNHGLRTVVGPLILGPVASGYLAKVGAGTAGAGGMFGWFRSAPKKQQAAAAGVVAATLVAGLTWAVVARQQESPARQSPPAAAPGQQSPAPPAQPPAPPGQPPAAPPGPEAAFAGPSGTEPASRPQPSPRPAAVRPRLSAAIKPVGALLRDHSGVVLMSVHNAGRAPSDELDAVIDLPPGVFLVPSGTGGRTAAFFQPPDEDGWSCEATDGGARCRRAPMPGGSTTTAYLRVDVAADAPLNVPPRLTLRRGDTRITVTGTAGVRGDGVPARYATDGHVRTLAVGNALLSCDVKVPGCAQARDRRGDRRNNDDWWMRPLDLDGDPSTTTSSSARVRLPPGARVRWAGLYWSGIAGAEESRPGGSDRHPARMRLPAPSAAPTKEASPHAPEDAATPRKTARPREIPLPVSLVRPGHAAEPGNTGPPERTRSAAPDARGSQIPVPVLLPLPSPAPEPTRSPAARRAPTTAPTVPSATSSRPALPTADGTKAERNGDPHVVRVRAPGAESYTQVRAGRVDRAELPSSDVYQSFADVTDLVRRAGGGQWWVADAATKTGWARYAGWSLVVVVEDPQVPWQETAILEGSTVVSRDRPAVTLPLHGLRAPGRHTSVLTVGWEGDADLDGDKIVLDGTLLRPVGGDRDATNALDSSALGAVGPALPFGVDVDRFDATMPREPTVTLTSAGDAYLLGVLAITAPLPS